MNEKFKQLALEAKMSTADFDAGSYYVATPDRMQLFAELIVRECADIINHRADTCSDWLDSIKANEAVREVQRECAKTIKEHFGVEQ